MTGNILLPIAAFLPIAAAPLAYAMGRKWKGASISTMISCSFVTLAILIALFVQTMQGANVTFAWAGFCGNALDMQGCGFRCLYASIAAFMWLVTSIFSRDYFRGEHAIERYSFFTLITLGATVGLFLSNTLFSAYVFFEVMSLASYPWVAHEEDPEAMRAAETYLYIAVIGGLVMLMGLFLLPGQLAVTAFAALPDAVQRVGYEVLWLPAILILIGFGAKAGAFPLHIWLPKAHPVAPAPSSALLSGMLTKAGIFGMLVLTCGLMLGCTAFGDLIFRLGVITMFLGALLAIFSTNLKRTLACSSLSQIGFIMIGVGVQGLCAGANGLAAYGTIQHMVNHSLFKLILFLCAGAVAMNAHALSLDEVRGFGRKKPLLHFCFLMGMLGIAGVPLFSGYISKSLLHEGMLEYIAELGAAGGNVMPYKVSEWIFIISGGMTLCYMFKLYICLFWQKNPTRQEEYDGMKHYMSLPSAIALGLCACIIPVLGLLPGVLMTGIGELARPFMNAAAPHHSPIAYFSAENLIGALKSIVIGAGLFALNWFFVMAKGKEKGQSRCYPQRWPKWLDLEDGVYRPVIKLLISLGYAFAYCADKLLDWVMVPVMAIGGFIARFCSGLGDSVAYGIRRLFLPALQTKKPVPVGNRVTYTVGRGLNKTRSFVDKYLLRNEPVETHYEASIAAGQQEVTRQFKRLTKSISFSLMMFCIGLFITLAYLLWR